MSDDHRDPRDGTDADDYVHAKRGEIFGQLADALIEAAPHPLDVNVWDTDRAAYITHATRARPRSAMLIVAQYWNDNADDEVHLRINVSSGQAPRWPHECEVAPAGAEHADGCGGCVRFEDHVDWGYLDIVRPLEPFCCEGAHQNEDANDAYRPLAIARLVGDRVVVEPLCPLIRPWLDMPTTRAEVRPVDDALANLVAAARTDRAARSILGDALQRLGDPRGNAIAHAIAGAPDAEELLARHGRSWFGAVERYVPRSAVTYEDGIPIAIGLWLDANAQLDFDDPRPWSSVSAVRFLPYSARAIVPAMRHLRALGPIFAAEVEAIARSPQPFALEELTVELVDRGDLAVVVRALPNLPALTSLALVGDHATAALLPDLEPFDHVTLSVASRLEPDAHAAELRRWRAAARAVAVQMWDVETMRACGWTTWLAGASGGYAARLSHVGYHRDADAARLEILVQALGDVQLASSPTWTHR